MTGEGADIGIVPGGRGDEVDGGFLSMVEHGGTPQNIVGFWTKLLGETLASQCDGEGDFEGWEHQLVLDEARRRFALGARLGAPFIVATPPLEKTETEHLPERYVELLEIGREEGIRPTFEYISFFKSVHTLNRAWEIVQEADDRDATLILDAFHNWNSGSTLDDLRAIPVDRISHYHIDDAHPEKPALTQTDPDRVMIGDGQINLVAEVDLLKEMGYDGTVSLELFNEHLWTLDPAEVLKVGLERMGELFGD